MTQDHVYPEELKERCFIRGWAYKCKRCHSLYTKGEIVATTEGFTCPNCGGVNTLTEDI